MSVTPNTRSIATLRRITEATRRLLASRDYDSLSMRAIAAEAGVSPGAIYKHFSNKRHLVDHVCHETLVAFEADLEKSIAPHPEGSFDRVVAQGAAYIQLSLQKPEHFKILFTPVRAEPAKLSELPGEGGFRLLRQCVSEAIDAGSIRAGDPDLMAFFLWSRVHGIVTLMMACDFSDTLPLPKDEVTPDQLFELSRSVLWEGFKPAAGGSPDGSRR